MFKTSFVLTLALFIVASPGWAFGEHCTQTAPKKVFVVRHGDKVGDDGPLTEKGLRMAQALAAALKGEAISAIYVSEKVRTQQMAVPLSKTVKPTEIEKRDIDKLGKKLCESHANKTVLVVGHSDTIPDLLGILHLTRRGIGYCDLFEIEFKEDQPVLTARSYCEFGTI